MLGTTRKILGDDYLAVEVSEDRVVASKEIEALRFVAAEISHQDRDMALILLSIVRTLEAREKGRSRQLACAVRWTDSG